MPKSPSERKAAQRARQAAAGVSKREYYLDVQELKMLAEICTLRRPGREPYEETEAIAMLIRENHNRLMQELVALNERQCEKCGDRLPVKKCCMTGDAKCWATKGWHEVKLRV